MATGSMAKNQVNPQAVPPVNVFVMGRTGAGKSSLINAIIKKLDAKEGKELKGETSDVTSYPIEINGVQYNIWDSSGFQDRGITDDVILDNMLTQLQICKHLNLLVYCLRMDTDRIEKNDELAIMRLTDCFGPKIWKVSVFALTFANKVDPPPDMDTDELAPNYFKQRLEEYKLEITKVLVKKCRMDEQKASEIAVIPTGYNMQTRSIPHPYKLLDREDWFNPFWITCADRMTKTARNPFFLVQKDCGVKLLPQRNLQQQLMNAGDQEETEQEHKMKREPAEHQLEKKKRRKEIIEQILEEKKKKQLEAEQEIEPGRKLQQMEKEMRNKLIELEEMKEALQKEVDSLDKQVKEKTKKLESLRQEEQQQQDLIRANKEELERMMQAKR